MNFFWSKRLDFSRLTSILERGAEVEISELLWQPNQVEITYLPSSINAVQKLASHDMVSEKLTIYKTIKKGRFELLIFNVPWTRDVPYYPLIIHRRSEKIVGIMLPFNELHPYLSGRDGKQIGDLAIIWTTFIMKFRFSS